jgi:hypothetical protein
MGEDNTHEQTVQSTTGNKAKNDGCTSCVPVPIMSGQNTGSAGAHSHTITGSTANTGSGTAMNVLQPYIALYYIIKY